MSVKETIASHQQKYDDTILTYPNLLIYIPSVCPIRRYEWNSGAIEHRKMRQSKTKANLLDVIASHC